MAEIKITVNQRVKSVTLTWMYQGEILLIRTVETPVEIQALISTAVKRKILSRSDAAALRLQLRLLRRGSIDEMAHLYESGLTLQQIGERFGLTLECVRQRLKRHRPDIIMRRGRPAKS